MWAICRACSGSERAVSVNGVFFRVVCVQCAINVYRKAVRTVRERGAAGEGVGARARTTDRLPSPSGSLLSLAIILYLLGHCFMLCYAFLMFLENRSEKLYICIVMHASVSPNLCNIIQLIPYTVLCISHVWLIRTTHHAFIFVRQLMHPDALLCMHMWHLPYARLCISVRMHCDEWLMHVYARLCVMQLNVNLSSCVVMLPYCDNMHCTWHETTVVALFICS